MSLELVAELWNHIKSGMPQVERDSTAEFIVNMLAENGIESEEIKEHFSADSDIKNALLSYFGEEDLADWDEDEDDFSEYDEDDGEEW
jgi:hypothetical protein